MSARHTSSGVGSLEMQTSSDVLVLGVPELQAEKPAPGLLGYYRGLLQVEFPDELSDLKGAIKAVGGVRRGSYSPGHPVERQEEIHNVAVVSSHGRGKWLLDRSSGNRV